MSIIVSDLSYHYPNQDQLLNNISFSVAKQEKVSLIGDNGTGKSTLLKLVAGILEPSSGSVASDSPPYYIRQHTGALGQSVAEVMRVKDKIDAFNAIANGSVSQSDYETLGDDWDIEARCRAALDYWKLPHVEPGMPVDDLSGGEKTKVLLAGLIVHEPEFILLDEPSNHLDSTARALLYKFIDESKSSFIIVSHDISLLDRLDTTYELSFSGIKRYGGNYSFYKEQKEIEDNALNEDIGTEEKALRLARKKAQEVRERQEKRYEKGQKNKTEVPRILRKTLTDSSQNTGARLNGQHEEIINESRAKLTELRKQRGALKELKINFDNTSLHSGKLLARAEKVNFAYDGGDVLWAEPVDFSLYSNDRVRITGDNGTGKTTLIKLLTGTLTPSEGEVDRAAFSWIYLDQEYSQLDTDCTVMELASTYNTQGLQEHEVRLRLNRFLFPTQVLDVKCGSLSGGEKMRLFLCCLTIGNQTPDLIILDEPTNNLDISSLEVLTRTVRDYRGSLLVISHDSHFVKEIGITSEFVLSR